MNLDSRLPIEGMPAEAKANHSGRSTVEGRDLPQGFRHSQSEAAREPDAPYGPDVTGTFSSDQLLALAHAQGWDDSTLGAYVVAAMSVHDSPKQAKSRFRALGEIVKQATPEQRARLAGVRR